MVEEQLIVRGIHDPRVLEVFGKIERHMFVPHDMRERAYDDYPLPIGQGQTISQPYMVAYMTQCLALTGHESVLEIGTGSGYQTAVLASLSKVVYRVERLENLSVSARCVLAENGFSNVMLKVGDGTLGWKECAPFDRIIVTAATSQVPEPLVEQLAKGGKLLLPLGESDVQTLTLIEKNADGITTRALLECVFVPLIGAYGRRHS